jgi:hypothetical protein
VDIEAFVAEDLVEVVDELDPACDFSQGSCDFTTVDNGNASHLGKIVTTSEGVVTLTGECVVEDTKHDGP